MEIEFPEFPMRCQTEEFRRQRLGQEKVNFWHWFHWITLIGHFLFLASPQIQNHSNVIDLILVVELYGLDTDELKNN